MNRIDQLLGQEPLVSLFKNLGQITDIDERMDWFCHPDNGIINALVELWELTGGQSQVISIAERLSRKSLLYKKKTWIIDTVKDQAKTKKIEENAAQLPEGFNIELLHLDKNGNPINHDIHNLIVLIKSEYWDKIHFDEFTATMKMNNEIDTDDITKKYRDMTDNDVTKMRAGLNSWKITPKQNDVALAMQSVALQDESKIDTYKMWIESLPEWDRKRRLNTYLFRHLKAWPRDKTEWRIISKYGRKTLLGLMARAMQPGTEVRTVLMLEGGQGIGKTHFCQNLTPFYVALNARNLNLGHSDAYSVTDGVAVAEIPENILGKKNDADSMKVYFSMHESKHRMPWGKYHVMIKRRNIFIITLNPESDRATLNDPTGNTRYFPIEIGIDMPDDWEFNIKYWLSERDQLLAEALYYYRKGEQWWLTKDEEVLQKKQVASREVENPSIYYVEQYLRENIQWKDYGVRIERVREWIAQLPDRPRLNNGMIANALSNLGLEQDRFYMTADEREKLGVTTRQYKLWFKKGEREKIVEARGAGIVPDEYSF